MMKEVRTGWAIKVWHPEEGPQFKCYYDLPNAPRTSIYPTRGAARNAIRAVFDPKYFKQHGLPVPRVVKVQEVTEVI